MFLTFHKIRTVTISRRHKQKPYSFIRKKKHDMYKPLYENSRNSPDLNLTEHVWNIIKKNNIVSRVSVAFILDGH